jgi:hypothetical protein
MALTAQQPSFEAPASEWLVWADALQEARDPRGELIVLNHAVEAGTTSPEERDTYVTRHVEALVGKGIDAKSYRFGWHHGLLVSAAILGEDAATAVGAIEALFASPGAKGLRSASLVGVAKGTTPIDLGGATEAFARLLPSTCKTIALVDDRAAKTTMLSSRDFTPGPNLVQFGDVHVFFANPNVESVSITVADAEQLGLTAIAAPHLASFTLSSLRYGLNPYEDENAPLSEALGSASWPKLESLEVRLTEEFNANVVDDSGAYVEHYAGNDDWAERFDDDEGDALGDNEGASWEQLRALLVGLKKTPLKRLALTSVDSASSLLDLIADVGLPATLEELDLSDGSINDASWFTKNRTLLAPLKRLVLERTSMTDEDAKSLAGIGPEVRHSHAANGARFRYIVGSE